MGVDLAPPQPHERCSLSQQVALTRALGVDVQRAGAPPCHMVWSSGEVPKEP